MNRLVLEWAANELSNHLVQSDERLPSLIDRSKEEILLIGFVVGIKHAQRLVAREIKNVTPDYVQMSHIPKPQRKKDSRQTVRAQLDIIFEHHLPGTHSVINGEAVCE